MFNNFLLYIFDNIHRLIPILLQIECQHAQRHVHQVGVGAFYCVAQVVLLEDLLDAGLEVAQGGAVGWADEGDAGEVGEFREVLGLLGVGWNGLHWLGLGGCNIAKVVIILF